VVVRAALREVEGTSAPDGLREPTPPPPPHRPPSRSPRHAHRNQRPPGSHLSRGPRGDVGFFVSDSWHRRLPPQEHSNGRHFLQINYGRREIAQRILPGAVLNPANDAARARARTLRERQLLGIHDQGFYDA
jgi:hypothetical protein